MRNNRNSSYPKRAKTPKAQEQMMRAQKVREERAREQKAREENIREERAREQRAQEERAREQKAQEEKEQEEKRKKQSWWLRTAVTLGKWSVKTYQVIIGILALCAGFEVYEAYVPKISITASDPSDGNPFSAPFYVDNVGNVPIFNVQEKYAVTIVTQENGSIQTQNMLSDNEPLTKTVHKISSDGKTTILLPSRGGIMVWESPGVFRNRPDFIQSVDMTIIVTDNFWLPYARNLQSFRFKTLKTPDGKWHWESVPDDSD